ncbi:MAG: hypothetical protein EAZ78_15620 [Oscillatoriales cyanobacterium]|uniref:Uncharacterized protein n=1 Tax=Microcoleus anatoxicus PTRS2 TaxID=2705321 RepID=A0ABU8YVD2_9CYAN|nr:MAG: hypothetical protein EA000_09230 [Oscillatoriales cyanobacterium]TAD98250.1 MAG: hypothetical protein EAZ96_24540 [Oscillatoriales cyanobacterium]TAD98983.1 MAG: hypothetical protein EAZ98_05160 [Oscillatoriales cyanobacterium]TAF02169.1 MAG: hypothetical protein EAZ78_15620 [Oscillatoriales cyanobacterium]TAF39807.1 MAG: hypothetical protein EAZ68_11830 [Oscillatoriales cyanobacterium]
MAKFPPDITEIVNRLKQQSLDIVDGVTAAELALFELFGETEQTLPFFDELMTVLEDAEASYMQLSRLGLNIARSQPDAPPDMLELMNRAIVRTQTRIPAWERSLEEVKLEWNLP